MKGKQYARFVKLYFRDQDKVMRAIPNIEGLVVKDTLTRVYTLIPRKLIYQVEE